MRMRSTICKPRQGLFLAHINKGAAPTMGSTLPKPIASHGNQSQPPLAHHHVELLINSGTAGLLLPTHHQEAQNIVLCLVASSSATSSAWSIGGRIPRWIRCRVSKPNQEYARRLAQDQQVLSYLLSSLS
jgi:hypothetical protein